MMSLMAGMSKAHALDRGPAGGPQDSSTIQAMVPGSSESMRRQMFRELLGAHTQTLAWPSFPRIWLERNKVEAKSSNTSFGLKVPILNAGGKLSIRFRYGLKTTLVITSSMRKSTPGQEDDAILQELSKVATDPTQGDAESQLLRWDEASHRTYPNVKKDYPMVGFCAFEASLSIDKNWEAGAEFFGTGQSFEGTEGEVSSQTLFSNFFQIHGDVSVNSYLEDVCGGLFRAGAEPFVVNDFSKIVAERVIYSHPSSNCSPDDVRLQAKADQNDPSCDKWHSQFNGLMRKITVARCQMNTDGSHRCALRSKENAACPMYFDKQSQSFVERPTTRAYNSSVTYNAYEFQCDEKQGYQCEISSEPWMLAYVPVWKGHAYCRKK